MEQWPELPFRAWRETYASLHRWLQIVGKIRFVQWPWINHQWHCTLYISARGLTTLSIPHGGRFFQIDFDFIEHRLMVCSSDGRSRSLILEPQSVAAFYHRLMAALDELDLSVTIDRTPNELADVALFHQDKAERQYDREYAQRFWRVLAQADRVFNIFRARFVGKSSPVHFFWGHADLALARFSGRRAPEHPGGLPNMPDRVMREAYSHECSTCGFWSGDERNPFPLFFSHAYPEPKGFRETRIRPEAASYSSELGEFILPYDAVRESAAPDDMLLTFLQSSFEAAATLGDWPHELEK
jgi:hypothetical protein